MVDRKVMEVCLLGGLWQIGQILAATVPTSITASSLGLLKPRTPNTSVLAQS